MKRSSMAVKRLFVLALWIVMCALSVGCGSADEVNLQVGDAIFKENDSLKTFDNKEFSFTNVSDKRLIMLNIWGTFCVECDKEFPILVKLQNDYADKGVQVIGLPMDAADSKGNRVNDKYAKAADIIAKANITYTNIIPDSKLKNSLLKDIQVVPVTVFINSDGRQIGDMYYGAKSYEDCAHIINEMLK